MTALKMQHYIQVMRKPVSAICEQMRRSACAYCAYAQSDQRLCQRFAWSKIPKTGFLMMRLNSKQKSKHIFSKFVTALKMQCYNSKHIFCKSRYLLYRKVERKQETPPPPPPPPEKNHLTTRKLNLACLTHDPSWA